MNETHIPLHDRRGNVVAHALVDPEDFERFGHHRWSINGSGYVFRKTGIRGGQYLHRAILGFRKGDGRKTDHKNGNKLDNRRSNLRGATQAQNLQNFTSLTRANTSGYRGVTLEKNKATKPWKAYAMLNGRQRHIGYFAIPEEAAKAASDWRRLHMPFSSLDQVAA